MIQNTILVKDAKQGKLLIFNYETHTCPDFTDSARPLALDDLEGLVLLKFKIALIEIFEDLLSAWHIRMSILYENNPLDDNISLAITRLEYFPKNFAKFIAKIGKKLSPKIRR